MMCQRSHQKSHSVRILKELYAKIQGKSYDEAPEAVQRKIREQTDGPVPIFEIFLKGAARRNVAALAQVATRAHRIFISPLCIVRTDARHI